MKFLNSTIESIKKFLNNFVDEVFPDPVNKCELYKDKGYSHVDSYHCNFPNCEILYDYKREGKHNCYKRITYDSDCKNCKCHKDVNPEAVIKH